MVLVEAVMLAAAAAAEVAVVVVVAAVVVVVVHLARIFEVTEGGAAVIYVGKHIKRRLLINRLFCEHCYFDNLHI